MGVHWKEAFTTSSTILAIYIQQFWDTMYFNSSIGLYNYQLDEQWFNLHKDLLRDALDITPTNDINPFVAPPSSDTVIEYVNTLGYPCILGNVSAMSVNALYQPWRAVLSMLNTCLTEFIQSIQTFLTNRKSLTTASREKKKTAHLLIPSVRFVGKDNREIFGMPIPDALLTDDIKRAPYYDAYLEHVAKYQQHLDAEYGMEDEGGATESPKAIKVTKPKATKVTKPAGDKAPKPISSQPPKPTLTQTEPSKKDQGKNRKLVKETSDAPSPAKRAKASKVTKKRMLKSSLQLVDEFVDEGVPEKEHAHVDEEADHQRALELSLKDQGEQTQGPTRPVVIRETDSGRIQLLPDVQGKGKEKEASEIHAGDQDEGQAGSNHGEKDEGQAGPNPSEQDKGQAGPNPVEQDKGQAGSNPGDAAESQPQSSHVVNTGPNLEHMDSEATDASTQQNPEQIDEEFTKTAYPNVQENLKLPTEDQVIIEEPASSTGTLSSLQNLKKELSFTNQFFVEKPQEEKLEKTNAESEVQSMVMVPIHQDTSSAYLMHSLVIDLTVSHPFSIMIHAPLPTLTTTVIATTTTTSLPPPPPQPQQSTTDPILVRRIASFCDLPAMDMKEILQQRMFKDKSYEAHEDHKNLYDALQKSLEHDYSNQLLADLDEARKKKRKRRELPRTPPGSPHSQPPPPPPPASVSGALGTLGASGSSQLPPPPPPPLFTGTSRLA
ncbi:retrovirus-related pol polyprotein from transposon TNT 1-94 [Tanacetum coccineum]